MITVIVPALNEAATIEQVVEFAKAFVEVTEVIVVDDGSIDGTPELASRAGARVITSTLLGKGASMEDGVWAAQNELVVFLDGDLSGLGPDLIQRLVAPILNDSADFVKARFTRSAGRVTTLTARPLLNTFFPELTHIEQPLGGIIAAKRSLFRNLKLETDYGVDVGLLLDFSAKGATIAQVDIGHIQHDSQPLERLGDMAKQVVRTILDRAARYGRLDGGRFRELEEVERHSQAELACVLQRIGHQQRLALFDMDGTLVRSRFIVNLAVRTNRTSELEKLLDHADFSNSERTQRIAALFQGVPRSVFEEAASSVPLMPGAVAAVLALRKAGYRVGIVSDSFHVATEIVRRRVFADFSIAHVMRFRGDVATGAVTLSPAMQHSQGCARHDLCKHNVLLHLTEQLDIAPSRVVAVGDSDPDICMLQAAGVSFAIQPKSSSVTAAVQHVLENSLAEMLPVLGLDDSTTSSPNGAATTTQKAGPHLTPHSKAGESRSLQLFPFDVTPAG